MTYLSVLTQIILAGAILANLILAYSVVRHNYRSATNRIFGVLSVSLSLWLCAMYAAIEPKFFASGYYLFLSRLTLFLATPMNISFFLFAYAIPGEKLMISGKYLAVLFGAGLLIMISAFSPYGFSGAEIIDGKLITTPGAGFPVFGFFSIMLNLAAVLVLVRKFRRTSGVEHSAIKFVLLGILSMFALIIATIFIPVLVLGNTAFVTFAPAYALIFLSIAAYAIVRYRLFNLKVIAVEAFTAILWIVLFSKIAASSSSAEKIVDGFVATLSVIFGMFLIKSVRKEVAQREEMEILNKKLEEANLKLEELSHFKTQLLSLASHQIKSPLAAIKGFASLVSDGFYGPVNDKVKEVLGKVKDSANGLVDLINTLLDFRRAEEGRIEYNFSRTDIVPLARDIVAFLQPAANVKKISLTFSGPDSVFIEADGQKLKQVFQNIVDNAVKYTPSGFVKVEIEQGKETVNFSVADSGLGISKDLLPLMFEEFVRDDRVRNKILGTGLGLYIARKIVEAHGGRIWAESEGEGKGSKFSVVLPMAPLKAK